LVDVFICLVHFSSANLCPGFIADGWASNTGLDLFI
jgi:hypothetical protein